MYLFVSEGNSSLRQVVGRHFHFHLVAGQDADVVHSHLAADVGGDLVAVLKFDAEHCIAQCLYDGAVLLYSGLFRHID